MTSGGVPVLRFDAIGLEADCAGRLWLNTTTPHIVYSVRIRRDRLVRQRHPVALGKPGGRHGRELGVAARHRHVRLARDCFRASARARSSSRRTRRLWSRRCRSTSRSSSTTCRRAASPGTSSMARRERESCRAARRRRRPSTSAPTEVVTRRSMAGFIERAIHGALTPPPVYLNGFEDVLAGSFNANYIQGLVDDAITAGCSVSPPLYCPDIPVTRAQMAVFMWKALHGSEPPPACRASSTTCRARASSRTTSKGSTTRGSPRAAAAATIAPTTSITNAQMAVFLVKAFELRLPGDPMRTS